MLVRARTYLIAQMAVFALACGSPEPGTSPERPIPADGFRFFERVFGPCGSPVTYEDLGLCCPQEVEVSPGTTFSRREIRHLRKYAVSARGLPEPIVLYLAEDTEGTPSVPSPLVLLPERGRTERYSADQIKVQDSCPCQVKPAGQREYSEEERCLFSLLENRCAPGDQCLLDCFASGAGDGVGGGCWHICFAYTGLPFSDLPKEAGQCL